MPEPSACDPVTALFDTISTLLSITSTFALTVVVVPNTCRFPYITILPAIELFPPITVVFIVDAVISPTAILPVAPRDTIVFGVLIGVASDVKFNPRCIPAYTNAPVRCPPLVIYSIAAVVWIVLSLNLILPVPVTIN